jgi:hypothetical protein
MVLSQRNAVTVFPTWKTIKLGRYRTPTDYRRALKAAQVDIRFWWAKDALKRMPLMCIESDVRLVVTSPGELGLGWTTYVQLCSQAQRFGLTLCSAEVGPTLRLGYLDQPEGETLFVAMSPIRVRDGDQKIFTVCRFDGTLLLHAEDGSADSRFVPHARFVFVRPH